jgi:ArsR family transcriptional regulator
MDSSNVLRIFASVPRLKLITCLKSGRKNVSELIKTCGLSQSAVSQHLSKLKKSGLVKAEKEGRTIYYSLADKEIVSISQKLFNFLKKI